MREAVYTFLEAQNIPYRLQEHEAVFTVAESSMKLPEKVPVKTLLVTDEKKQQVWMVAMRGLNRLDMKNLAQACGVKKLQFVRPERVEELVGVHPRKCRYIRAASPGG
jgi:Ala-tRNA(Pro) deacylase